MRLIAIAVFAECLRLSYRSTIPSLTRNFASRHASHGPANLLQDPKEQTNGYKTTQKISIANLLKALTSTRKRCGEVGQGSLVRAALSESQNSLELLALDVSWSLFLLKAAAAACNSSVTSPAACRTEAACPRADGKAPTGRAYSQELRSVPVDTTIWLCTLTK